ncbi:MAG: metallophosphoesterase family protein, partial [Planctomycetota bacterium]
MDEIPIAFISDIHANLEALNAVLEDIRGQDCARVVCLGDLVGYGPDPDDVVSLIMDNAAVTIAGNHDWALLNRPLGFNRLAKEVIEYTKDLMEPKFYHLFGKTHDRWEFLEGLPETQVEGSLLFVHGSPRDPTTDYVFGDRSKLWNPEQIEEIMNDVEWLCFCGHTHFPVVIRDDLSCWYPEETATEFDLERG